MNQNNNFESLLRRLQSSPARAFLEEAGTGFTSPSAAGVRLRQLGNPPPVIDISNPTTQLQTVLKVLGYLAYHVPDSDAQVLRCLKQHWSSHIYPWIEFLIEKFVLTNEAPSTIQGCKFLDNILNITCTLLSYPCYFADRLSGVRRLQRLSPRLQSHLAPEVWVKVLELQHETWDKWNVVMTCVFLGGDGVGLSEEIPETIVALGPVMVERTGKMAVQHIRYLSRNFHDIHDLHLETARTSLRLLEALIKGVDIFLPFIHHGGASALVHLFSALVAHVKDMDFFSARSEKILDSIKISLILMTVTFKGPETISPALEAGLIQTIFKMGIMLRRNNVGSFSDNIIEKVIIQICPYMFYSAVCCRFTVAIRKARDSGLERQLKLSDTRGWSLRLNLEELKRREYHLRQLLDSEKKDRPWVFCGFEECSLRDEKSPQSKKQRYVRCTACQTLVYCSRTCAKRHWEAQHRDHCGKLLKERVEGVPVPTNMDFSFFTSITQDYVDSYEEEILDNLDIEDSPLYPSDTDWDPASSPVRNLPADANLITRDIVIVDLEDIKDRIFDLDDPDFYSYQDLRHFVSDPRVCSNQVMIPRLCSVLRQARKEDIVVVGIFPATRGMVQKAWFVVEVKEYQEDTKTRKWNLDSRSWNAPEYYENVGSDSGYSGSGLGGA